LNVGLKIIKCSQEEFTGAMWVEIHIASINSNQFNIVEKGRSIFSVYPYRTMYEKDTTRVWGTFKRAHLADDFEKSKEIISKYGEIELVFQQNCFLEEGQSIIDANIFDSILND